MKQNFGYRLGIFSRNTMRWFSRQEAKMQQQGVPRWLIMAPRYLVIVAIAGLLLVGAFYLALFLALMVFIAFYLSTMSGKANEELEDESVLYDKTLNGYHQGPEGPGIYEDGIRVSRRYDYEDDDEEN